MEEPPNDVIILSAIDQGAKKTDKISRKTRIDGVELDLLIKKLQDKGLVTSVEKKGFFGPKKELLLTEKGTTELDERRFELQQKWDQMAELWKSGDKQKIQEYMENNRQSFPAMMFMGIMDMMMFSSMMSFMGLAMTSFIPDQFMYDTAPTDSGHDVGNDVSHDAGSGDFHDQFGHDIGGFDVNF